MHLSVVWMGYGSGPVSWSHDFLKSQLQSPSSPIPLCLPTAIEPQNEEADENYNSVNTRMRKTQVGC